MHPWMLKGFSESNSPAKPVINDGDRFWNVKMKSWFMTWIEKGEI